MLKIDNVRLLTVKLLQMLTLKINIRLNIYNISTFFNFSNVLL